MQKTTHSITRVVFFATEPRLKLGKSQFSEQNAVYGEGVRTLAVCEAPLNENDVFYLVGRNR